MSNKKLKHLYQLMADHTLPKCRECKPRPYFCCSSEYCAIAYEMAKENNISLEPTTYFKEGKTDLPFMTQNGCIVEPWLRPICTLHECSINALGFNWDDKWTKRYFQLRKRITDLEARREQNGL